MSNGKQGQGGVKVPVVFPKTVGELRATIQHYPDDTPITEAGLESTGVAFIDSANPHRQSELKRKIRALVLKSEDRRREAEAGNTAASK